MPGVSAEEVDGAQTRRRGIGNPASLVACVRMGYGLFDCALPTRDARRGRLYAFRSARPDDLDYQRVYIRGFFIMRAGGNRRVSYSLRE